MAIEVIAAGLGRTGTLSMKFALERLGFGPCHHMTEVFADAARQMPLWIAASEGRPDWDEIFRGFRSTSDYPSAVYWRELSAFYPQARIILAERDADAWFDSTQATIFAPRMRSVTAGSIVERFMRTNVFDPAGSDLSDRAALTAWYRRRNDEVRAAIAPERLLEFRPAQGWGPLCAFLGVPMPDEPFPHVNERPAGPTSPGAPFSPLPDDPALLESPARLYIDAKRQLASSRR
ncbi:sulfotransferase family protein [Tsuneonella sp. HG222]